MWKRLRLLTLSVATVLLAIFSFPTWGSILQSRPLPGWDETHDFFGMYVDFKKVDNATLSLNGRVKSTTETGLATPQFSVEMHLFIQPSTGLRTPLFIYYKTAGRVDELFKQCIASKPGGSVFDGLTPMTDSEAQAMGFYKDRDDGMLSGDDDHYYRQQYNPSIDWLNAPGCQLDPHQFWAERGSRAIFAGPTFFVDVLDKLSLPPEEVSISKGKDPIEEIMKDPSYFCSYATLSWGPGVSQGNASPRATEPLDRGYLHLGNDRRLVTNGFDWPNCLSGKNGLFENGFRLLQGAPAADLTDNLQADNLGRRLFLGGAFVGVLGALAIEIVNALFDVADLRKKNKLRRHRRFHRWAAYMRSTLSGPVRNALLRRNKDDQLRLF